MKKLVLSTLVIGATLTVNANSLESTLKNANFSNENKISQNSDKLNIGKIFNFIKKHRKYISEYNLLTVDLSVKTEKPSDRDYGYTSTSRNSSGDVTYSHSNSHTYNNDRRDTAYIELKYPLYNASKEKSMKNEKLRNNQEILYNIRTYFQAIDSVQSYKNTILFYENKLKNELKKPKKDRGYVTSQINSITTIQSNEDYYSIQILNAKNRIISDVNILIAKEYLLDLVEENYKSGLDRILSK
jgi:hypothetical protein